MQTVCKFMHCLPQMLLVMLGRQVATVATNIISVCSCFFLHNLQFAICLGSIQKEDLGKRGSATQEGCCDPTSKGNLEVGFS